MKPALRRALLWVVALGLCLAFVRAGLWQSGRAAEKDALLVDSARVLADLNIRLSTRGGGGCKNCFLLQLVACHYGTGCSTQVYDALHHADAPLMSLMVECALYPESTVTCAAWKMAWPWPKAV